MFAAPERGSENEQTAAKGARIRTQSAAREGVGEKVFECRL